ncbi:2164_t:CDS:1, partial [Dentiscutata heterogama]
TSAVLSTPVKVLKFPKTYILNGSPYFMKTKTNDIRKKNAESKRHCIGN